MEYQRQSHSAKCSNKKFVFNCEDQRSVPIVNKIFYIFIIGMGGILGIMNILPGIWEYIYKYTFVYCLTWHMFDWNFLKLMFSEWLIY